MAEDGGLVELTRAHQTVERIASQNLNVNVKVDVNAVVDGEDGSGVSRYLEST